MDQVQGILLAFLLICTAEVTGLKCYTCTANWVITQYYNKACSDEPVDTSTLVQKQCKSGVEQCFKAAATGWVTRGCLRDETVMPLNDYLRSVECDGGKDGNYYHCCKGELCNAAPTPRATALQSALMLVVLWGAWGLKSWV